MHCKNFRCHRPIMAAFTSAHWLLHAKNAHAHAKQFKLQFVHRQVDWNFQLLLYTEIYKSPKRGDDRLTSTNFQKYFRNQPENSLKSAISRSCLTISVQVHRGLCGIMHHAYLTMSKEQGSNGLELMAGKITQQIPIFSCTLKTLQLCHYYVGFSLGFSEWDENQIFSAWDVNGAKK